MRNVAAVAVGSSPVLTFGALQLLGSGQTSQWSGITDDFMNLRFWFSLMIVLLCGAFGGIAYELLLRGGAIELPHRVRAEEAKRYTHAPAHTLIALGIFGRAIVGAAAALTLLFVVAPTTAHSAIAMSVTAGAAAPAMIRLMRKQLMFAADLMSRMTRESAKKESPAAVAPVAPTPAAIARSAPQSNRKTPFPITRASNFGNASAAWSRRNVSVNTWFSGTLRSTANSAHSAISTVLNVHEPYIVSCLWMTSGVMSKVAVPRSPTKHARPQRAGRFRAVGARFRVARAVQGGLRAFAVCQLADRLDRWCGRGIDRGVRAELERQGAPLRRRIDGNDSRAHHGRELRCRQADRSLAKDGQRIPA